MDGERDQPLFPPLPKRGTSAGFSEAPGKALLSCPANCEPQRLPLQDRFRREAATGPPGPGRWVPGQSPPWPWRSGMVAGPEKPELARLGDP